MIIEQFTPEIIEDKRVNGFGIAYISFALPCHTCACCGALMIQRDISAFAPYWFASEVAQVRKAKISWRGQKSLKYNDQYLCEECSKTEIIFECFHCHKPQGMEQVKRRYGDDCICLSCYKSLTAERWDDVIEELRDIHRYDNE